MLYAVREEMAITLADALLRTGGVLFTGNRGLAGAYNGSVLRAAACRSTV